MKIMKQVAYWGALTLLSFGVLTVIGRAQLAYPQGPGNGNLGLTTSAINATGTIPAQQMVGVVNSTPTAAATLTTDTAANICALFPSVANLSGTASNFAWDLWIRNLGTSPWLVTLAGGSGVTLATSGINSVAMGQTRHYKVSLTSCGSTNAVAVQALESNNTVFSDGGMASYPNTTATGTAALAGLQHFGQLVGTPAAGATYTTDTATNICAFLPVAGVTAPRFGWTWQIVNISGGANTITMAGGVGVTLSSTSLTIAQNANKTFNCFASNCSAGNQAIQCYATAAGAAF